MVGVELGLKLSVWVELGVGLSVMLGDQDSVGESVAVGVGDAVGVGESVRVILWVKVNDSVKVSDWVGLSLKVGEGLNEGEGLKLGVLDKVGDSVGVFVGVPKGQVVISMAAKPLCVLKLSQKKLTVVDAAAITVSATALDSLFPLLEWLVQREVHPAGRVGLLEPWKNPPAVLTIQLLS